MNKLKSNVLFHAGRLFAKIAVKTIGLRFVPFEAKCDIFNFFATLHNSCSAKSLVCFEKHLTNKKQGD